MTLTLIVVSVSLAAVALLCVVICAGYAMESSRPVPGAVLAIAAAALLVSVIVGWTAADSAYRDGGSCAALARTVRFIGAAEATP